MVPKCFLVLFFFTFFFFLLFLKKTMHLAEEEVRHEKLRKVKIKLRCERI